MRVKTGHTTKGRAKHTRVYPAYFFTPEKMCPANRFGYNKPGKNFPKGNPNPQKFGTRGEFPKPRK